LKPEDVVNIPEDLASATKPDDHYLIQALLMMDGAILVTTDNPLREALGKAGLNCISREEFLNSYF
jgi:rRNA-processing protein FCF1